MVSIGIVGATGLVGREMLSVLQESTLSVSDVRLFASERSEGQTLRFGNTGLRVEIIKKSPLEKGMILLGATSADRALEWIPWALESGATVIDNSSAYRMASDVPLIVPEVNPHAMTAHHRLIANPNCSTIQLVMALAPLRKLSPFRWVSVSTYQSVSGAGRTGLEALALQRGDRPAEGGYHGNVVCEIGPPDETGYTGEESKLIRETVKIMEDDFPVYPACARVPVEVGHTESVTVMFSRAVDALKAEAALASANGVEVLPAGKQPVACSGTNSTFVGRVRSHPADSRVLQFWVTADNVRKGAALNAVQILELAVAKLKCGN